MRRKTTSNGEIGLKNGGDLVEDVDREGSADATDVVATKTTKKTHKLGLLAPRGVDPPSPNFQGM